MNAMDTSQATQPKIQAWCVDYISRMLDIPADRIDPSAEIDRIGLDSATAVAMIMELEDWLGIDLPPELLFEYSTLGEISGHLAGLVAAASRGDVEGATA